VIQTKNVNLGISLRQPENATTKIEPNLFIGAGLVDKGERQQRGERLAITTAVPTTHSRFVVVLKIAANNDD
jgi:hypothetical protein